MGDLNLNGIYMNVIDFLEKKPTMWVDGDFLMISKLCKGEPYEVPLRFLNTPQGLFETLSALAEKPWFNKKHAAAFAEFSLHRIRGQKR